MRQPVRDDEELLIARSQRGDLQAFNQLVLLYQQAVYSLVFRMLGNPDNAADITQDAFLAAFRGINTYRGGSSFRAWLLRISTNQVYDYLRRVQRRPAESLEALTEDDDMPPADFLTALTDTDRAGNPEERILTQELQAVIQQGLEDLPIDQRIAVVLWDFPMRRSRQPQVPRLAQCVRGLRVVERVCAAISMSIRNFCHRVIVIRETNSPLRWYMEKTGDSTESASDN